MLNKVVIDTNVWISALFSPAGIPRKIANYFEAGAFILVCSDELITELVTVISRPEITAKLSLEEANELVSLIIERAVFVQVKDVPAVSPDPKDDIFLASAATAVCDFLVTGNRKDLLDLGSHGQTKIVSPRQFLEILQQQN